MVKHGKKSRWPRCIRCNRPVPASQLHMTAEGLRCESCANKMPKRLRQVNG